MNNINTLLREARESKGFTIKEAAKALKLRERHIQMLEDGRMSELSHEIYLKGFLKTYTNWLNIDSSDVIGQINQQKKKVSSPVNHYSGNPAPIVAMGFSYIGSLVRRPGLNVFLLSSILTVIIYIFWANNHKNVDGVDMINALQKSDSQHVNEQYSNVLEEYRGKDLVFFPHADVEIKITDTASGEEKINKLADGDVFFIKASETTVISSDTPSSIEVFIDGEGGQEPIGTLDNVLMKF